MSASSAAFACDLCAFYSANQARTDVGEGPFLGVAEQFTHFGTVQVDGHEVSNPSDQYMDSSVSQLFAGYNFSSRFGVQVTMPLIYRSFKRPDGLGGIDEGTESGLGDVALLGNLILANHYSSKFAYNWSLLAGIKFPTGDSDRLREEFNEVDNPVGPPSGIHGHDLALGSGSYDGIIGTGIYVRWKRVFLSGGVQYAIRSTGDFDYRYANDLTWSGGPGYMIVVNDDYTLGLQAVVSGEWKKKDTFQGEEAEDTGVTSVYLGPQINMTWGSSLSAQVAADLPVSIQNTSLQTVPDYRVRASVSWHF